MHDFLDYMAKDPALSAAITRATSPSRCIYAFHEHFILVLSHDEVVHGKGSLLNKMPGDRLAEVRQPADVLRLDVRASGQEAALHGRRIRPVARVEPRHQPRLAPAATTPSTTACKRLVQHLNWLYKNEPALYDQDDTYEGFEWIDFHDSDNSVVAFMRKSRDRPDRSSSSSMRRPSSREAYRVGVTGEGFYEEILNTDAADLRRQQYRQLRRPVTPSRSRGRANRTRCCCACRRWRWSASNAMRSSAVKMFIHHRV